MKTLIALSLSWNCRSHQIVCRNAMGRRAFTLIEMIGTCVLLSVVMSITVPTILVIAHTRRSTEQRQFALQHAANLLERATSRTWSELPPGELKLPDADPELQTVLPGLERTVTVKQIAGENDSRQILASIRWQNATGQFVSPLQLSAWICPTKEVP